MSRPRRRRRIVESVETWRCLLCGGNAPAGPVAIPGLRGEEEALREAVCSAACALRARQFAARRGVQTGPARAGLLVALLGVVTGAGFLATGRDLGRPLIV